MNLPTIIAATVVVAILLAIIVSGIRNRKKGKSACASCNCSSCGMKGQCHPN